jgi:hypothetical protein
MKLPWNKDSLGGAQIKVANSTIIKHFKKVKCQHLYMCVPDTVGSSLYHLD